MLGAFRKASKQAPAGHFPPPSLCRFAMPELPEVETTRRGIAPELTGLTATGAIIRNGRLRLPIPPDLDAILAGQQLVAVERRAKYLLLRFSGGSLLVHLGMSGSLRIVPTATAPEKHDHIDIVFGLRALRLRDPRRFGLVLWQACDTPHPQLSALGIEPLGDEFDGPWLYKTSRGRKTPVKLFIMDGTQVVGIGNIYASESLFRAGISPLRAANRISRERYGRLVPAIRQTLSDAIAAGGSSIRDYVHSDGGAGCFQVDCAVYDRAGEPCRRCDGVVRQVRQGGRSTFYCAACQH